MQISTLLGLKHCLWHFIENTPRNEFKRRFFVFSCHFPCYNQISVTTNIKNSGLLVRIQGKEEHSAAQRKLRVSLGQFCSCVGPHWKQIDVKRWGFIIPRWNLPGLFTWCKGKMCWNSRQFPEYFGIFAAAWSYRALQKNSTAISQENLLASAGNLKVNERTKYKSVPIFLLFLAVERKPEIRNYWIFEPPI